MYHYVVLQIIIIIYNKCSKFRHSSGTQTSQEIQLWKKEWIFVIFFFLMLESMCAFSAYYIYDTGGRPSPWWRGPCVVTVPLEAYATPSAPLDRSRSQKHGIWMTNAWFLSHLTQTTYRRQRRESKAELHVHHFHTLTTGLQQFTISFMYA